MYRVSYFISIMDTKPVKEMTMEGFYQELTGPALGVRTDAYRRYVGKGMLKEAGDIKLGMPGVTVAGLCRGKRAAVALKELSGWMMLDFDDTNERTEEIRRRLMELPYVTLVWVSISGAGLKAVICIDAETAELYVQAYAVVAREVSACVDFKCDMQCKDLARYCSAAYDPAAYYNPDATVFEWRAEAARIREEEQAVAANSPAGAGQGSAQGAGTGFVASFLESFLRYNPFVAGARHDSMLKLGRSARNKGFSQEELASLIGLATVRLTVADFTADEIRKSVSSGYQYVSSRPSQISPSSSGVNVQRSPLRSAPPENDREMQRISSMQSDALRAGMPHFPQEVYDALPDLLKRALSVIESPRERDMLLMALITHLSADLPGVSFIYQQREFSPHLFFAGVSPAGTGKGVVMLALYLSQPLHEFYMQRSAAAFKDYKQQLAEWEIAQSEAKRQHRKVDFSTQPEEPKMVYLLLPANESKSRLYAHLRDNGSMGGIIHASEINTLVSAVKQDYGKQDDVLCAAFHHEDISSSFKVDGLPVFISNPRLAMCLTGTPNQFVQLVHSQENGLYSRLALLTAEPQWTWRSAAPREGGVELRSFFRGLGKEVLEWHKFLLESPTEVLFRPEQWAEHDACFSSLLDEVVSEGESSSGSIVLRLGIINARIASVLTALRKCEDRMWGVHSYYCTDGDFHVACLMTRVLLEHSLLLSSSLPELGLQSLPLREFHSLDKVLSKLSEEFTYSEFVSAAVSLKWSDSTGRRMLKRAEEAKVVVHEGNKYRKISSKGGAERKG